MNKDFFSRNISAWNEDAIKARAKFLAENIIAIWPMLALVPASQSTSAPRPKTLVILGEPRSVQTWRDVAYQTAECIIQVTDNFEEIMKQMPAYFDKEEFKSACRQLSNGWWIYVNLSGPAAKNLCRRLIISAGISEDDWQLEEE